MSMIVGDANITAPNKKVMPHPMLRPKGIISNLTTNNNGKKSSNSIDMSGIMMGTNNSSNILSTKVRASIADKKQ